VISLVLVVLLVHYHGAMGGAIAVATRPLVAFLLRLPYLRRHVSCFWPWKQMAQLVVALFLMAIPLAFVRSSHGSVGHAALVLAAAGIYAISLAAMRVDPMAGVVQRVGRWALGVGREVLGVPVRLRHSQDGQDGRDGQDLGSGPVRSDPVHPVHPCEFRPDPT